MKRYQFYESLSSIKSPLILFHTLTLDFILTLSTFKKNAYNTILLIINKFIKRIINISKKFI